MTAAEAASALARLQEKRASLILPTIDHMPPSHILHKYYDCLQAANNTAAETTGSNVVSDRLLKSRHSLPFLYVDDDQYKRNIAKTMNSSHVKKHILSRLEELDELRRGAAAAAAAAAMQAAHHHSATTTSHTPKKYVEVMLKKSQTIASKILPHHLHHHRHHRDHANSHKHRFSSGNIEIESNKLVI